MMISPKRILWPTDFSELSLRAGKYARGFRDVFGAQLHVIHVIPPPLSPETAVIIPADVPIAVSEPEVIEAAKQTLDRLRNEQFDGDENVVCQAFYGNPWTGICQYAKDNEIDLIVIATHGHTGLRRVLIGSTAERVVQHAPCPVLTIKDPARGFLIDDEQA